MGYCITVKMVDIVIHKENKEAALAAIKALHGKETVPDFVYGGKTEERKHFRWVDTEKYLAAQTLEECLRAWRWRPKLTERGDINDLEFTGEKLGDDDLLFTAIAPFVEPGSFIHFVGEEGHNWKYKFDGNKMKEVQGKTRVIWDREDDE